MAIITRKEYNMKRKHTSLQKQIIALEKKLYPHKYSYRAFTYNNESYIQFGKELIYPVELVQNIIKSIKKDSLKTGTQTVGLILEIPSDLVPNNLKNGKTIVAKPVKKKKIDSRTLKTAKKVVRKKTRKKKVKQNGKTKVRK